MGYVNGYAHHHNISIKKLMKNVLLVHSLRFYNLKHVLVCQILY